jgi:hypothetical protein
MRLTLAYAEMLYATDQAVVTALAPAPGSPITVTDCGGHPAGTGRLQLGLDLAFIVDPADDDAGALAFKSLAGSTFKRGPVVAGIIPGAGMTASGTLVGGAYTGAVTLDVAADAAGRELQPQFVRLGAAIDRVIESADTLYLGLPPSRAGSLLAAFAIPGIGLPASPVVTIRALLYATAAGTLPALSLATKSQPAPGVSGGTVALNTTPAAGLAWTTTVGVAAGQCVLVESAATAINPGDTLFVKIGRAAGDGYTGEVGVVTLKAVLAAGS